MTTVQMALYVQAKCQWLIQYNAQITDMLHNYIPMWVDFNNIQNV